LATRVSARLSPREGRRFGLELGAALAALGGFVGWRGHPLPGAVLGALGGLLVVAALVWPGRLGPVQRVWMTMAAGLSQITTPLVMGVVYFLVVTPVALARRLVGRNPLAHGRGRVSCWVPRPTGRSDIKRQF
jgi:hypothetical protein